MVTGNECHNRHGGNAVICGEIGMIEDVLFIGMTLAIIAAGVPALSYITDVGPFASKSAKDFKRRMAKTKKLVGNPKDTMGNEFYDMICNAYKHAGYRVKSFTNETFLAEKDDEKVFVGVTNYYFSEEIVLSVQRGMEQQHCIERHGCKGVIFYKEFVGWMHVQKALGRAWEIGIERYAVHDTLNWLCGIYFPREPKQMKGTTDA